MTATCRENSHREAQNEAATNRPLDTTRPNLSVTAEKRSVPRLALSKAEASAAIGCSIDFFEAHVMDELRVVRRGRRVLVPVVELERWLAREAALTLGDPR